MGFFELGAFVGRALGVYVFVLYVFECCIFR